jgi:hypothetical protein
MFPTALDPGVYSASNINEYQIQKNNISWEKSTAGVLRLTTLPHGSKKTLFLCGASFLKLCTKLMLHCNHRSGHFKTEHTENLLLLRRHFGTWSLGPAVSTRNELLVANEKLGEFPLLTMYVMTV